MIEFPRKSTAGRLSPQPFTVDECRALIKQFKTQERLKPYFPLFALLLSTGSRPNEIRALKWTHILGLWQGHQGGTQVPAAKEFVLSGRPVFMELAVNDMHRTHIDKNKRFKHVKNGTSHQPELNRFIPGHENLFEEAIKACLPTRNLKRCMADRPASIIALLFESRSYSSNLSQNGPAMAFFVPMATMASEIMPLRDGLSRPLCLANASPAPAR